VMVSLIIAFPGIVTRDTSKAAEGNLDQLQQQIDSGLGAAQKPEPTLPDADKKDAPEDPMEAIRRANEQDKAKK
jgi:hypothetical protein